MSSPVTGSAEILETWDRMRHAVQCVERLAEKHRLLKIRHKALEADWHRLRDVEVAWRRLEKWFVIGGTVLLLICAALGGTP